jgi:predicted nucleic acid-binding protein
MPPELHIDTGFIRHLRDLVGRHPELLKTIGQFAQFRVVIDVNIVISDLLLKVKYPERGNTALEELVHSSILEVFAPRWLENELPSAFNQVSQNVRIAEDDLWAAWRKYQVILKWDERFTYPAEQPAGEADPKDLPYIQLEKVINAVGILSKDRHIERMGGNRLTLDFVFDARCYARAAAISVTIRASGIYLGTISLASLLRLAGRLTRSLEKVRPELKVAVLAGVLFAFFHPTSRAWIIGKLKKLAPAAKFAIDAGMVLVTLEQQNREDAKLHLAKVSVAADPATNPARLKVKGAAGSQSNRK